MASSINADNGVSSGSAGLKSSADSSGVLQLQTNGTTAVTIDASQNAGVGVTPSAWISGSRAIQIGDYSSIGQQSSGSGIFTWNAYQSASGFKYLTTNPALLYQLGNDGVYRWYQAGSGTAGNAITLTQAMTLDTSGNLGVGVTSMSQRLVVGGSANTRIQVDGSSTGGIYFTQSGSNAGTISGSTSAMMFYAPGASESMRLDTSGRLLVGAASFPNYGTLNSYTNSSAPAARFVGGPSTSDGTIALMVDKYSGTNTTSQWFLGFTISNQTTASGVITANGASQAAFGSWSDRRLKENIVDLPPQLDNIMALRPVEFDYIESEGGGHQISFIAQEFEEVYPDAIGERSDGMKTLTGWSKTEARLVKAIQEMKAIIDTQASTITQLQADVAALKGA